MNTQIATTIEQSERLVKCGIPADTADMSRGIHFHEKSHTLMARPYGSFPRICKRDSVIPAWSLSRLLRLLPKTIKANKTTYKLNIDYPPIGQVAVRYNTEEDDLDSLFGLMGDDLIELIVLMVEKLTANGHKLNGINK